MAQTKLIVTDLDGTLLKSDNTLGEYTKTVFQQLKKQGIKICFASGRANQMMSIYQAPMIHCDYHVSFNGAVVENLEDRSIIYKSYMNSFDAKDVLNHMLARNLKFTMYTNEKMYYMSDEKELINRFEKYESLAKELGYEYKVNAYGLSRESILANAEFEKIAKIVLYEKDEKKIRKFIEFIKSLRESTHEATGYGLTGIFSSKVSKKNALMYLQKNLGINSSETCVFGDYDNDSSLFEAAETKVAVSNATEEIKKLASHMTGSNDEEGVADFIEKNIL